MKGDNPIDILWSVKGCHVNRITPPPEVTLQLEREPNNRYNRNAILVKLPRLVEMPEHVRDMEWIGEALPVRQLAGRTIGHVPANLCRTFNMLQERGYLLQPITANAVGRAQHTVIPPVWARFQHRAHGRLDHPGGGVEVPYLYHLHVNINNVRPVMALFEQNLARQEMWRFRV